jgi:hypothetical protein
VKSGIFHTQYFLAGVIAALIESAALAATPTPTPAATSPALSAIKVLPPETAAATTRSRDGITVLFLGDSLALCGFGKRLDERLRATSGVNSTFTYMACATQPLSWLKDRPYGNVKTRCGFWTIESVPGSNKPKEMEDMYGMKRRSTPKSYPVPKLEDLLAHVRPDVLIMQTGGNLFDLFPDHKTVRPDHDAPALRKFVVPFLVKAAAPSSSLRKIYWVASPTSGRVSKAVQDFVVEQVRAHLGRLGTVIDSRPLVSYPYHHMEPDKEHFSGADMDQWADKVFEAIQPDLSPAKVAALTPLNQLPMAAAASSPPPPAESPKEAPLSIVARLAFKSKPMRTAQLLPYQESLVGFVYDVKKVEAGQYSENQILVMHPAHIALKRQSLRRYHIGRTYKLHLRELEGTPWNTCKRRDDSGLIDLQPYIQVEDEKRFPETNRSN